MKFDKNFFDKKFLIAGGILFMLAFFIPIFFPQANWKLVTFVFSGILVGLFYGSHNHEIWPLHLRINSDKEKTAKIETQTLEPGDYERYHVYWVHIVGGVSGGVAAYFLTSHICFSDPTDIFYKANWVDFVLILITVLGYTGYMPRTLWFIANKGGVTNSL